MHKVYPKWQRYFLKPNTFVTLVIRLCEVKTNNGHYDDDNGNSDDDNDDMIVVVVMVVYLILLAKSI